MRIRDPNNEMEEPFNLVPLTDMVFNLLIFFMAATTFAQVEKAMGVQLPHTAAFTPLSAPPKQLIINIMQDGSSVVAGKTYDLPALSGLVTAAAQKDHASMVIIRADERSIMKYFAGVARVCKQAGITEAKIVYMEEPSKPAAAH